MRLASRECALSHSTFRRSAWKVVKMLVAVVVLFAICWGPILIDNVLTAYGYLPRIKDGTHKHLNTAFQLMAYFNRYEGSTPQLSSWGPLI